MFTIYVYTDDETLIYEDSFSKESTACRVAINWDDRGYYVTVYKDGNRVF